MKTTVIRHVEDLTRLRRRILLEVRIAALIVIAVEVALHFLR